MDFLQMDLFHVKINKYGSFLNDTGSRWQQLKA